MIQNPKSYEVILYDHSVMGANERGAYLEVFNYDGKSYKIGEKRSRLWGVFNSATKETPILMTFETFTPADTKTPQTYVVDAKPITTDDILRAGLQSTLKRLLTSADDDRNRSQALAYAKDLTVAQITVTNPSVPDSVKIIELAKTFFYFIKGIEETKEGDNDKNGNEESGETTKADKAD